MNLQSTIDFHLHAKIAEVEGRRGMHRSAKFQTPPKAVDLL